MVKAISLLMFFSLFVGMPAQAQLGNLMKKAKNVVKDSPKEAEAAESNLIRESEGQVFDFQITSITCPPDLNGVRNICAL